MRVSVNRKTGTGTGTIEGRYFKLLQIFTWNVLGQPGMHKLNVLNIKCDKIVAVLCDTLCLTGGQS